MVGKLVGHCFLAHKSDFLKYATIQGLTRFDLVVVVVVCMHALHCSRQSACRAKSLRVTLRKADFAKAELRARACERACDKCEIPV